MAYPSLLTSHLTTDSHDVRSITFYLFNGVVAVIGFRRRRKKKNRSAVYNRGGNKTLKSLLVYTSFRVSFAVHFNYTLRLAADGRGSIDHSTMTRP